MAKRRHQDGQRGDSKIGDEEASKRRHQDGIGDEEASKRRHQDGVGDEEAPKRRHQYGIGDEEAPRRRHQDGIGDEEAPKRRHQDGIGDGELLTKDASCTRNVNDTHGIIESTPEEASNMRNPYDIPGKESVTKEIPSHSLRNHTKKTASKLQRVCLLRDIDQDNGKQESDYGSVDGSVDEGDSGSDYIPESDYGDSDEVSDEDVQEHSTDMLRSENIRMEGTQIREDNNTTELTDTTKLPDVGQEEASNDADVSSTFTVYPITTPRQEEASHYADVSSTSTEYPIITPKVIIQERFASEGVKQQKYFSCLYCETLVTKLPRHLERKHPLEDKVKTALQLPKKSNERRLAWSAIEHEGNYNHNYGVLAKGSGLLIPKYRNREDQKRPVEDYVPCEFCFGLYVKTDLWKHHSKCQLKKSRTDTRVGKPVANGKLLLPSKASAEVAGDILVKMRDDEIKDVITNDSTLLEFANRMHEQNGHLQHRHQYIAQRLRELSRLLIEIKEKYATIDTIEKCLDPPNWEKLINAVKGLAGFDPKSNQYSTPTLPLRLGQSLVKCAKLLKTRSIVMSNEEMRKKMDGFIDLHNEEWTARVAAKCHSTLHVAKFNKPQLLPVTKDVQKFHTYLKEESEKLRKNSKKEEYRRFAEICLAQIILFNRKRSGEAERIKIEDFEKSVIDTEVDEEIIDSLTPLEKEIIKSHKRIEIVGKRGSKVPVILTDDMIENLNCLLKTRQEMGITTNFLFGKPNSQFPIRGSDALRKMALECGASNPTVLTSTKLRKQLATLSQVLGLNEHGQDALAKFMGHDIRVHRSYYELPENTMQLARMSKVLHAVNEGKAAPVSVGSLEEIDITEEGNFWIANVHSTKW